MLGEAMWALPVLARIVLRKEFGREPTRNEVDRRVQQLKEGCASLPPLDIITAAFENGEEVCSFHRRIFASGQSAPCLCHRKRTLGNSSVLPMKRIYSGRSSLRFHSLRGGKLA